MEWPQEPPIPTYRDLPLGWQCGSEEELRTLTRAICLTDPVLFNAKDTFTVVYRAATEEKRGGFLYVERKGAYSLERYISPRLTVLCELAYRLNAFRGMRWIECPGKSGALQKQAIRIRVSLQPPSAHEKADALLTLMDWLEGRLRSPHKLLLAGIGHSSSQ